MHETVAPAKLLDRRKITTAAAGASDEVIDSTFTRPRKPAVPECPHICRLGDTDGKKIGFDQQKRTAWSGVRNHIRHCGFGIRDMMKHCTRRHQIERSLLHRTGNDVAAAQFKIRSTSMTGDRSRSTATAFPPGVTRSASHAEIEPLPHPISSSSRLV